MSWIRHGIDKLTRKDRRGTVTVFVAVWLLVVFGIAAVGVDGGAWYLQRRQQQNAADMAAFAGIDQVALGSAKPAIQDAGQVVAAANGFSSPNGATVTINYPPASGPYAGNYDAVEAIIHRPAPMMLARFVQALGGFADPTVGTRAVALYSTTTSLGCVLSLKGNVDMGGNNVVTAPACALISNNAGSQSIDVAGSSSVTAGTLSASGFCKGCADATLASPYLMYQLAVADPFAALQTDTFPTEPVQTYSANSSNPQPGYYQGIQITSGQTATTTSSASGGGNGNGKGSGKTSSNGGGNGKGNGNGGGSTTADVVFSPGLYVIGSGGLQIDGGTVSCSACTFVFVNGGTVTMNGTATVNLTAMTKDALYPELDGILFYGDGTRSAVINGGSSSTFTGAVYFPNANVQLNGNETNKDQPATQCFITVAASVTFLGNGASGISASGCSSLNLQSFTTRYARLVQ